MLLWVGFAVLTAAVIFFVTRPITSSDVDACDARDADLAVYKDQLSEVESDLDRGLISSDEAGSARAELARRLIRRAEQDDDSDVVRAGPSAAAADSAQPSGNAFSGLRQNLAFAAAAIVPLIAVGLYLAVGSPGMPGQPYAEHMSVATENASVAELVGKIEAELRQRPDDGKGWAVLAPVYMRMQRFDDAANAYAQSIRLLGETPQRLAGFAEATIVASNGLVPERARLAFERLLVLDPKHVEARFWLAQAKEQDGDKPGALTSYRALLDSAPADAPWRGLVEERIAAVQGETPNTGPSSAPDGASNPEVRQTPGEAVNDAPGPSAADIAAAGELSADQRSEFINQMVTRLSERLKNDGKDAGGWTRLIRAYVVLGRKEEAVAALAEAKRHFADDAGQMGDFEALSKSLGLGS